MRVESGEAREFSLIIPVYRPDVRFVELMRRTALQTVLPEKILLVETVSGDDDGLMDQAIRMFEHEADRRGGRNIIEHVKVLPEQFDHGGTRDMAAGRCTSDLLVFMTMDALPADRRLFEYLTAPFSDEQVACAYGRQLPDPSAGICERFTRQFNYPDRSIKKTKDDLGTLGIKTFFCSNVCAAYRRNTYLELGGFEKRTIFNEDMIFAGKTVQAGYAVFYEARARVIHSHNYTGLMQLHRNFDLGVSQAQHPEVFADIRSDREGIRLVKETMRYLAAQGKVGKIPGLIWQSGCKYLGYRLGKGYRKLPMPLVRALSWNKRYWDVQKG